MPGPNLSFYKRWKTYYYNYWQIDRNLSETAHQERLWSKVVVPSKIFFPCRLLFLMAGNSFFRNIVSLLHESNYSHLFLNGECNFRRIVAAVNCLYTMYLANISIYLRRIVISKEHLQPCISVVPSLFQQTNYSDLVFSVVLYFFETSICNHSFFQRYWLDSQLQCQPSIRWMVLVVMKEQLEPLILSNVLSFWRIEVEARRYRSYQQGYLLGFKQVYIER